MSGTNATETVSATVLESYGRLMTQQNLQTNETLKSLTESVNTLVKTSIQSEERHKQYDDRFERIELNQKQGGIERKELTEHMLIMSKDLETNAGRWGAMYKILSGVFTTILGAAIVAAYIANK